MEIKDDKDGHDLSVLQDNPEGKTVVSKYF
jgi:hypothetical protein